MNVPNLIIADIGALYVRYGNYFGDFMIHLKFQADEGSGKIIHWAVLDRDYAPAKEPAFAGFYDADGGEPLYYVSELVPEDFQWPRVHTETVFRLRGW